MLRCKHSSQLHQQAHTMCSSLTLDHTRVQEPVMEVVMLLVLSTATTHSTFATTHSTFCSKCWHQTPNPAQWADVQHNLPKSPAKRPAVATAAIAGLSITHSQSHTIKSLFHSHLQACPPAPCAGMATCQAQHTGNPAALAPYTQSDHRLSQLLARKTPPGRLSKCLWQSF